MHGFPSLTDRTSLKKHDLYDKHPLKNIESLFENSCLFDEQMDPSGKFMSVRRTNGPSWKIIKRLLLEKKNRYFRKLSRWLLLCISLFTKAKLYWRQKFAFFKKLRKLKIGAFFENLRAYR